MANLNKVLAGLAVMAKYGDDQDISVDHDVIFAGGADSHKDKLAAHDLQTLEDLGWHWSAEFNCWRLFA